MILILDLDQFNVVISCTPFHFRRIPCHCPWHKYVDASKKRIHFCANIPCLIVEKLRRDIYETLLIWTSRSISCMHSELDHHRL